MTITPAENMTNIAIEKMAKVISVDLSDFVLTNNAK
jgi:hypothetical protein